jgi:hypothetical protein
VATKFIAPGLIPTLLGDDSWSLLYWHLRYRLKAVQRSGNWWGELVERFEFVDEKKALET